MSNGATPASANPPPRSKRQAECRAGVANYKPDANKTPGVGALGRSSYANDESGAVQ